MAARTLARTASATPDVTPDVTLNADTLLSDAVTAIVRSGVATESADAARVTSDSLFIESSITTLAAIDGGVSTVAIAAAVKARVNAGEVPSRYAYTSNVAVGFHGMTGRFYSLPGDDLTVATGAGRTRVDGRTVQATIKSVGQTTAREVIDGAKNRGQAWDRLQRALRSKNAGTPVTGETGETGDGGESGETADAPTLASLIGQAMPILRGARKAGVTSDADFHALSELALYVTRWVKAEERKSRHLATVDETAQSA